jgi:hypothetical protein
MKNRTTIIAAAFVAVAFQAVLLPTAGAVDGPQSPEPAYLYKTTFVRAAPGKLLDLIALYKSQMAAHDASGDERPLWWRHTQGDQWDLMLLTPMGSYTEYYAKKRVARRKDEGFAQKLDACSSWREDIFVMGPTLETVKKAFNAAAYYHIEIFVALPGKQAELFKERVMENIYQVGIGRPENMIFVRDQGASWDLFTLGCYRDILHWAGSGDVPKDKRELAARRAGFNSPEEIGPYMRTLIVMHRDTMGVAIK